MNLFNFLMKKLVVVLCFTIVSAGPPVKYIGCYRDVLGVNDRALPLSYMINHSLTVDKCVEFCTVRNFKFSGAEYGSECWCGIAAPTTEKVDDALCDVGCGGKQSEKCGGALTVTVHENVDPDWKRPDDGGRPLLALVMMLKNEAHTIHTTINSVKEGIDKWFILDTGSNDGTDKKVKELFGEMPGQVFYEPFVDYGSTRNRIIDLANTTSPRPVFMLMMSADEEVEDIKYVHSFLETVRFATGGMHEAYGVTIGGGVDFETVRIGRSDDHWRYKGRVHEYWTNPKGEYRDLYQPKKKLRMRFQATDGKRRHASQVLWLKLLLLELKDDPNNTRLWMYTAGTYDSVGNTTGAFESWGNLARLSSWNDEVMHAFTSQLYLGKRLPVPLTPRQTEALAIKAHCKVPERMDAMHYLSEQYYNQNDVEKGYLYGLRLEFFSPPSEEDVTKIRNFLLKGPYFMRMYEYDGIRLLGLAAERAKDWRTCRRALKRLLKIRPSDKICQNALDNCEKNLGIGLKTNKKVIKEPRIIIQEEIVEVEEDAPPITNKIRRARPKTVDVYSREEENLIDEEVEKQFEVKRTELERTSKEIEEKDIESERIFEKRVKNDIETIIRENKKEPAVEEVVLNRKGNVDWLVTLIANPWYVFVPVGICFLCICGCICIFLIWKFFFSSAARLSSRHADTGRYSGKVY